MVHIMQNLRLRGRPPKIILHSYIGQWLPYNFVADSFHSDKVVRHSLAYIAVQNDFWGTSP